ncbi:hypothetical protein B0H14DRAFT_3672966 [Mycena olivaceomarginata]|nr:hypothetical protein B0H14DRAFT_3672966 [Mycena olivaceomarginata]
MSPSLLTGSPPPRHLASATRPSTFLMAPTVRPPSSAHQAIVDATQARRNAAGTIANLIKNIEDLDAVLPTTVAEGTDEIEIHRVLTTVHGLDEASPASTFTRRFGILFKEDAQCRDTNGCVHLIWRGELAMLMVVRYLHEIKYSAPDINLEGAVIKLQRVVAEMEVLCGMDRSPTRTAADARKQTSAAASKQKGKTKSANGALASSEDRPRRLCMMIYLPAR